MEKAEQENLVTNPYAPLEDKADREIPTATLQLYQGLAEYLDRAPDTHINRASSATLCYKRRWYQRQGVKGLPLTPRKLINFLLGDLTERTIQYFIRQFLVGPGKLYSEVDFGEPLGSIHFQGKEIIIYKQQDLKAQIGPYEFTAHADGWGKRNSDGRWELIEIKSSADYGFEKAQQEGPEYLKQAHVVLQTDKAKALGATDARFYYLKKSTAHVWDFLISFDPKIAELVEKEARLANGEEEPETPYGPERNKSGLNALGFPCTYCPYISKCHPSAELQWKKVFSFIKDQKHPQYSPVYVVPPSTHPFPGALTAAKARGK